MAVFRPMPPRLRLRGPNSVLGSLHASAASVKGNFARAGKCRRNSRSLEAKA